MLGRLIAPRHARLGLLWRCQEFSSVLLLSPDWRNQAITLIDPLSGLPEGGLQSMSGMAILRHPKDQNRWPGVIF